jgi:hypothetical protein
MNLDPIAGRLPDWLGLGAAPAFATMALLTAVQGEQAGMLCSAAQGSWLLSGMVPMYMLMSVFHSAPWLRLISSQRMRRQTTA